MFRSLRHRNARLFFVGLIVSNIGTWIQSTAMSIVVYRLTGRGTDVGINLLCQFLPMLLLGAWACDRVVACCSWCWGEGSPRGWRWRAA